MIYVPENSAGLTIVDAKGNPIQGVFWFNDETKEARFYLVNQHKRPNVDENLELIKCSAIITGAKMVPRRELKNVEKN